MKGKRKSDGQREAGILTPVSSLPGPYGIGDFGRSARQFVDWLCKSGIHNWSLLPLNATGYGDSPYQSPSGFAGNINYIAPEILMEEGLLEQGELAAMECPAGEADYGRLFVERPKALRKAFGRFTSKEGQRDCAYLNFCRENAYWLEDYAEFMAVKEHMEYRPWWLWPEELACRSGPGYAAYMGRIKEDVEFWKFVQFEFFSQWSSLKKYANDRGVRMMGDMPFYVAPDSADVWCRKELFAVDPKSRRVEMWAGVPADLFCDKDRSWGNPVYRWEAHKAEGYRWFRGRISICGRMYDALRIDHVIGMMRFFGIRHGESTGMWYDGPEAKGRDFSDAVCQEAEKKGLTIIAEDLGVVPPGLRERMRENGWAGMRVMQFAFTGKYGAGSNHLPCYYEQDTVVYTGTHDHPALKEFLERRTEDELRYMRWWTGKNTREELRWALIEEAYKSPAGQVVIPVQDVLGLGAEARMVFPAEYERSWKWRISGMDMLSDELAQRLKRLAVLTGRDEIKDGQEFLRCL